MKKRYFLVIGADRRVRVAVRPQIQLDEVAIPIVVNFPDDWGRVLPVQPINIDVPPFATSVETVQS